MATAADVSPEPQDAPGASPGPRDGFGVEGANWSVARPHRIRWSECDPHAHVNHTAYLTLCEDLRVAHWLSLGGGFGADRLGPVVAQLEARYLRPLRFGDDVLLTLRVPSLRRSSFVHEYAVWCGGLVFSARAVVVAVHGGTGERAPLPEAMRRLLINRDGAGAEA